VGETSYEEEEEHNVFLCNCSKNRCSCGQNVKQCSTEDHQSVCPVENVNCPCCLSSFSRSSIVKHLDECRRSQISLEFEDFRDAEPPCEICHKKLFSYAHIADHLYFCKKVCASCTLMGKDDNQHDTDQCPNFIIQCKGCENTYNNRNQYHDHLNSCEKYRIRVFFYIY